MMLQVDSIYLDRKKHQLIIAMHWKPRISQGRLIGSLSNKDVVFSGHDFVFGEEAGTLKLDMREVPAARYVLTVRVESREGNTEIRCPEKIVVF